MRNYYHYSMMEDFPQLQVTKTIPLLHTLIVEWWEKILHSHKSDDYQNISVLSDSLRHILRILKYKISSSFQTIEHTVCMNILKNLFCFLAYCRDIHCGLGQRTLLYSFLDVWYDFYPKITVSYIKVMLLHQNGFSYGSWRDICGLCNFLKDHSKMGHDHPLILTSISFMNSVLQEDWLHYQKTGCSFTNVAKWTPREKSKKNGWLYDIAVIQWSRNYTHYWKHCEKSYYSALLKSKTKYRQMVSKLNKLIDPIEIKLCAKENHMIHPLFVSHGALTKKWDQLFNQTSELDYQYDCYKHDICSNNLSYFFKHQRDMLFFRPTLPTGRSLFFPEHIDRYVSRAFRCVSIVERFIHDTPNCPTLSSEMVNLNYRWDYIFNHWNKHDLILPNSLPVLNLHSTSLHDPSFHKAIAVACFIAQASDIKRILFSSHVPIWINIENKNGFIGMIRNIYLYLHNQVLINSNVHHSMKILGKKHSFYPIIVYPNGHCQHYNEKYDYADFFNIVDSPRYEVMQHIFQNITCSPIPTNRIVYSNL